MVKIKVMSYNVLHGFHSSALDKSYKFKFEKERLESAQKIVEQEKPDILCLTEACFSCPNPFGVILDYKKLFGFNYAYASSNINEWSNMILSKYPLTKAISLINKDLSCISSNVLINNKELHIDLIHPSYKIRDLEKIKSINLLLKGKKEDYILTGDFNSLSDQDSYNISNLKKVIKQIMKKDSDLVIKSLLDRKFIKWLRKKGFIDIMKRFDDGYTIPTNLVDKEKKSPLRIDYFFVSKDIKAINAKVIKNNYAEKASDHYPLFLEINFEGL